jgi:hypothetical protein
LQRLVSKQQVGINLLTTQASDIGSPQSSLDASEISLLTTASFTTLTDIRDIETCEAQWSTFTSIAHCYASKHFTPSIMTTTKIFEVLEGVGEGEIYTTCDDIPHFRFFSSPTLTTTKLVSQTGTYLYRQQDSEVLSYQRTYSYPHCLADEAYCMKKKEKLMMESIDRHDKDLQDTSFFLSTWVLFIPA